MKLSKLVFCTALCTALAPLSTPARANIVLNGDFEADTVSGPAVGSGYQYLQSGLSNWTISSPGHSGVVLFNGSYAPGNVQTVGGGVNSLQIEYPGDYIEQAIPTVAGVQYTVSFLMNIYTQPGFGGIGAINVSVDGAATTLSNPIVGVNGWNLLSGTFIAADSSTDLRFSSAAFYPHLDNISVVASNGVPEPGMLALLGLAIVGFGFRRGKSKT